MPQGQLQLLVNMLDSGLNPQAAIDVPRFRFEEGHEVALESAYFEPDAHHFGGPQFIHRDADGTLIGGSEPRRDGQAIGS